MAMICFFRIRLGTPPRRWHKLEASGTLKEDVGDEGSVSDDLRREVILELPAPSGWRGNISKGLEPVKEEAKRTLLMKHEAETKTNAYWLGLLAHMQSEFVARKVFYM
ncbi:hypothetical protein ACQJBY_048901 [Aegilops geniculata]